MKMLRAGRAAKRWAGTEKWYENEEFLCYLMISTLLIGFLVLSVYPILWTFRWSFFQYNGIPSETKMIGMKNFATLFSTDRTYWAAWGNTLLFMVIKIPIEIGLALILALILSQKMRGSNFFRSLYYLPNIISVVIVGLIVSNLFNYFGMINDLLLKMGVIESRMDWFATKSAAMAMLVMGSVWQSFGLQTMYLIAALTNVPEELYECACIDGANGFVKFFKVTLPMIAPIFKIIVLLAIIGTLSANEYILVTTNGGPAGQTATVMTYLTKQFVPGFMQKTTPDLGYGCAMSIITTIIFAVIAALYNKFAQKMNSI